MAALSAPRAAFLDTIVEPLAANFCSPTAVLPSIVLLLAIPAAASVSLAAVLTAVVAVRPAAA